MNTDTRAFTHERLQREGNADAALERADLAAGDG
jgi:hypothetical protein